MGCPLSTQVSTHPLQLIIFMQRTTTRHTTWPPDPHTPYTDSHPIGVDISSTQIGLAEIASDL